jgi:dihydroorotate dehydrogenase (NAD+) catalytic subunit
MAPTGVGMLNSIGIQNQGIDSWVENTAPRITTLDVPVWGSAVGATPEEFATVAAGFASAAVPAVEVNLSCPNLEDGRMFSLDRELSSQVIAEVVGAVNMPVGAKLSPNTDDIVGVAAACLDAGASFLTLTNTALGFGVSVGTARPLVSGGVAGYSGPGLKPISLRCVYEVATAIPDAPIVGCGGVLSGSDVVEYVMAGASAVAIGTLHFARPKAGKKVLREVQKELDHLGVDSIGEVRGSVVPW